jgi:hypothetical protein
MHSCRRTECAVADRALNGGGCLHAGTATYMHRAHKWTLNMQSIRRARTPNRGVAAHPAKAVRPARSWAAVAGAAVDGNALNPCPKLVRHAFRRCFLPMQCANSRKYLCECYACARLRARRRAMSPALEVMCEHPQSRSARRPLRSRWQESTAVSRSPTSDSAWRALSHTRPLDTWRCASGCCCRHRVSRTGAALDASRVDVTPRCSNSLIMSPSLA